MFKIKISVKRYSLKGILFLLFLNLSSINAQDTKGISTSSGIAGITDSTTALADTLSQNGINKRLSPLKNIDAYIDDSTGTFINKGVYDFIEFHSPGDILVNFLPAEKNDFGAFGHPDFFNIYGLEKTSVLIDNLPVSSIGVFNFYNISLTGITRIEASSLTSGFLYGDRMNGAAVNFVKRDLAPEQPVTEIRYLQGANDEGEINIFFARKFSRRLIFSFNVANKSVSSRFLNSDYSHWGGFGRIKYLSGKNLNLALTYSYLHSKTGLNGGVDFDSIKTGSFGNDYNSILYNSYLAPALFPNRYLKTTSKKIELSINSKFSDKDLFAARIYYDDNLHEFRQNESGKIYSRAIPKIISDTKNRRIGFNFTNLLTADFITLKLLGNYENLTASSPLFFDSRTMNNLSLSGIASFSKKDFSLVPSLFSRTLFYNGSWFFGYGGELRFSLFSDVTITGSASRFQKPYSLFTQAYSTGKGSDFLTSELSVKYLFDKSVVKATGYLASEKNAMFAYSTEQSKQYYHPEKISYAVNDISTFGMNLFSDIYYGKFEFFLNATYNVSASYKQLETLPKFFANAGLYYIDSLFSDNLYLKTGFNFYFTGKQNFLFYNFQTSDAVRFYQNSSGAIMPLAYPPTENNLTLDFFLCGRIQDRANIYFIFENLTNKDYFVVPYYPKQSRGIRFGVEWVLFN